MRHHHRSDAVANDPKIARLQQQVEETKQAVMRKIIAEHDKREKLDPGMLRDLSSAANMFQRRPRHASQGTNTGHLATTQNNKKKRSLLKRLFCCCSGGSNKPEGYDELTNVTSSPRR